MVVKQKKNSQKFKIKITAKYFRYKKMIKSMICKKQNFLQIKSDGFCHIFDPLVTILIKKVKENLFIVIDKKNDF